MSSPKRDSHRRDAARKAALRAQLKHDGVGIVQAFLLPEEQAILQELAAVVERPIFAAAARAKLGRRPPFASDMSELVSKLARATPTPTSPDDKSREQVALDRIGVRVCSLALSPDDERVLRQFCELLGLAAFSLEARAAQGRLPPWSSDMSVILESARRESAERFRRRAAQQPVDDRQIDLFGADQNLRGVTAK